MPRFKHPLVSILLLLSAHGPHPLRSQVLPPPRPEVPPATWRVSTAMEVQTIAHQVLRLEQEALAFADADFEPESFRSKYELLDRVFTQAKQRIVYHPDLPTFPQQLAQARHILGTIERILLENNFLLLIGTEHFHEGLTPRPPQPGYELVTDARRQHFQRHRRELFHHVDCDLSSLLYLAIAEQLGLPLHMVEVPRHNFVRWRFSASQHLNWDTNAALEYSDDQYRQGLSLTSHTPFGSELEAAENYLADMTRDEVIGYFRGVSAKILFDHGQVVAGAQSLEQALEARPYWSRVKHNLAWTYLLYPEVESDANHRRALQLSSELSSADPDNRKYKNLLACAYAAAGDFEQAIETERQAYGLSEKLAGFAQGKTCLDIGVH